MLSSSSQLKQSDRAEEQSSKEEASEIPDTRHSQCTVSQRFDHGSENQKGMLQRSFYQV